jgi:hypothetical protein
MLSRISAALVLLLQGSWCGAAITLSAACVLAAAPIGAIAQEPVAPVDGEEIPGNDVVLRWALPSESRVLCIEWAARPETSYAGGPFLDAEDGTCALSSRDVAYLLENLRLGRYYWHVQTESIICEQDPTYGERCDYVRTWGRTAYFESVEPPPPPYPTGCSRQAAEAVAQDFILPYARRRYPRYYRGLSADLWGVHGPLCVDLTRDGDREMIVRLNCCTGGSLSPWAIFKHDASGEWRMAYVQVKDTVFRLQLLGRRVRTMMPFPYEGACTNRVRYRIVSWRGSRFRSRLTRRHRLPHRC